MKSLTEQLSVDGAGLTRAAGILANGGLVAFPTETVYGLGADARNGRAVAGIFAAKQRPSFNPLIVHVGSVSAAFSIGDFPESARALVEGGWPDALTLVVPLRLESGIDPLVTAGQNSVALRVPGGAGRALLTVYDGPVAAPSANPSGRISPTRAQHVLAGLDGKIDAVILGDPCERGLESTIVSFLGPKPVLLREGTADVSIPDLVRSQRPVGAPVAPGQLASHYAPRATLRLDVIEARPDEYHIGFGSVAGDTTLSSSGDLTEAAANLFTVLHDIDGEDVLRLAVAPIPDIGLGRAINDRLRRAAAPRR